MATQEESVVYYARLWYETERSAMEAPLNGKNQANKRHDKAKRDLRNAVCRLPGAKDETADAPES